MVWLSVAQVSHLLTGVREIGEAIARRIEEALKLEMGWMDRNANPSLSESISLNSLHLAREIELLPLKQRGALRALIDALAQPGMKG